MKGIEELGPPTDSEWQNKEEFLDFIILMIYSLQPPYFKFPNINLINSNRAKEYY